MSDGATFLAFILGFGFVLVAGAKLGPATPTFLGGLFPPAAGRDWPTGIQEPDAPRFAVAHLDALRPSGEAPPTAVAMDPVSSVDLHAGPSVSDRPGAPRDA